MAEEAAGCNPSHVSPATSKPPQKPPVHSGWLDILDAYNPHCALYTPLLTLYTPHFTLHNTPYSTLPTLHFTLYTLDFAHRPFYTLHYFDTAHSTFQSKWDHKMVPFQLCLSSTYRQAPSSSIVYWCLLHLPQVTQVKCNTAIWLAGQLPTSNCMLNSPV